MDLITFQYIMEMAIHSNLEMCLMDIVIAYLCGFLDTNIYMHVPPRINKRN